MSVLRTLAKRRFNFIDAIYLGVVGGQTTSGHYAAAAITFGAGVLISVAVEAFAPRGAA